MSFSFVVKATDKGRGVFAARAFSRGDVVLSTTGVVVPERSVYTIQIDRESHLLPDPPMRYLNHSCAPNLGVVINTKGHPDFVAMQSIEMDDELCFDYAMTEYSLVELEDHTVEPLQCACGASACRGRIGTYPSLPQHIKERYKGFIADYLLHVDEV